MRWTVGLLTVGLLNSASLWAGEAGVVVRPAELKQQPATDAPKVVDLPAQSTLQIMTRQGAWLKVEAAGQTGWVKMLNVRAHTAKASAAGGAGALVSLFATGSSGKTVTTGVKGLDEESIRNAQPNLAQLTQLQALGVAPEQAKQFAAQAKLKTVQIDYLVINKADPRSAP